ncbi:hypothetical protein [Streptomyces mirabilis]|jgi:hypothetical protein|uniref:hypothetical protein n=1 Tax=Streptomyces mirabilis TaxID=68239 RepID=UPI0033E68775
MAVGSDVDETATYLMSLDHDEEADLLLRQAEERSRLLAFVRSLTMHGGSDPTRSALATAAHQVLDTLAVPVVCDALPDGRHRIDPLTQRCTACCGLGHRVGKPVPENAPRADEL